MEIFYTIISQLKYLFLHPMLYFGILIIGLQYRRQIALERKLFSARIHSLSSELIQSITYGLLGGILASAILLLLGIVFHPSDMIFIWVVTGILALFHVRFLCLSYSVGIVGTFAGLVQLFNQPITNVLQNVQIQWLNEFYGAIISIHIPSLIAIVAILHLVEAVLIRLQASKQATPLFVESKRGKLVGGYHLQSFWLLPIFLVVATGGGSGMSFQSSWWPLIGGGVGALTILPVPTMIGYSDLTTVYSSLEKSKKAYKYLLIYSIILLGFAYLAEYILSFHLFAAIFAGLGHELIRFIGNYKENKLLPKFVHPEDGLKILAVLPGSLAEIMGIKEGEIIKKVNGFPVKTRQELHYAIQQKSAFVKLEILNIDGQVKFAQHSIYDGDHHQLGIILSPDDDASYYIEVENVNLWKLIKQRVEKIAKGA